MLAEFITRIAKLATEAEAVTVGAHPKLPDQVYVRHGTNLEWKDVPPPKRAHTLFSMRDLLELANNKTIAADPEVFHSATRVVVLLDRNQRREQITLPLVLTDRFKIVSAMGQNGGLSFDVAGAVRFIRFDLHGVGADGLVAALRKVDFTRKGTGASSVEHGRESLGKSVEMAVQQADQIPESILVDLPVFATDGLRGIKASVRVGLYLDVQNEKVTFRLLADELAAAVDYAQSQVHDLLVKHLSEVPVFAGEVALV